MLVVSRKVGEQVEFPDLGIVIRLVGIRASRAEIGVQAPRSMRILRGELVAANRDSTREGDPGSIKAKSSDNILAGELSKLKSIAQALVESGSTVEDAATSELVGDVLGLLTQLSPASAQGAAGSDEAHWNPPANADAAQVRQTSVGYVVGAPVDGSPICA